MGSCIATMLRSGSIPISRIIVRHAVCACQLVEGARQVDERARKGAPANLKKPERVEKYPKQRRKQHYLCVLSRQFYHLKQGWPAMHLRQDCSVHP